MSNLLYTYESTLVESIPGIVERLRKSQVANRTYDLEFRKLQLRKLFYGVQDNEQRLAAALKADLGRPVDETYLSEVSWLQRDILRTLDNMDKWAADEPCEVPFQYKLMKPRFRKEPMGTVLIIGPFNYPVQLVLVPLIGAIAAGCTAVVKPSEMTPHSAILIQKIVEKYLNPECYTVILGGIPETTKLLELQWDKICYTGNAAVGKIITAAAAKYLTPVLLELGGINPCLVTEKADAVLAAKRVAWGKAHNCGQICLSPDYVLIHPSQESAFVESYIKSMNKFFPDGPQAPGAMTRIVNTRHFQRIKGLLDKSQGKIVYGGDMDEKDKYIAPTLVKIDNIDDSLLSEEIFGPVLPFLVVNDTSEMIRLANQISDTPLAIYAFTNDKEEQEKILSRTRSGGATINDVVFHGAIQSIPLGGVGQSGTGNYRDRYSYEAFTHKRPIVNQPLWLERLLAVRYPPYGGEWRKRFLKSNPAPKANFDRNGKLHFSARVWQMLSLGAGSGKMTVVRYILALVAAFVIKKYLPRGRGW